LILKAEFEVIKREKLKGYIYIYIYIFIYLFHLENKERARKTKSEWSERDLVRESRGRDKRGLEEL
jgi:hypothetical protein